MSFMDLTGSLGPDRSVFGFQPRGLDGLQPPHSTLAECAECYLQALRTAYPEGPVHLLGHSFGGWVAFELAQRLHAAGRAVGSLTLVDSEVPDREEAPPRHYSHMDLLRKWVDVFGMILERPLGVLAEELEGLAEPAQLALLHECLVRSGLMPARTGPELLKGPLDTFAAALRASYTPRATYPGPVLLVLAEDRGGNAGLAEGWRRWAPGLEVLQGRGNHMTMLKQPQVQALALALAGRAASR
jgi:thioesterase domain-containing protein